MQRVSLILLLACGLAGQAGSLYAQHPPPMQLPPAPGEEDTTPPPPPPFVFPQPIPGEPLPMELPPPPETPDDTRPLHVPPPSGPPVLELPPDPNRKEGQEPLPPLEEELWLHGGSYLYQAEGDRLGQPCDDKEVHHQRLRLPENYQKPEPVTAFAEFVGADPIKPWPGLTWFGCDGFQWEPRFVGYGSYETFGIVFEENDRRQDLIGHQLIVDLDLRLTGTERFHVQYRPIGERGTGGSYYQFSNPDGYVDNSTAIPDRYWMEFELFSVLGDACANPYARDFNFVLGKVPFALHNGLLMNDEVLGVVVNKNSLLWAPLSNLNIQAFAFPDDVDAYPDAAGDLYGVHATADYRGDFVEMTYGYVMHGRDSRRDRQYAAASYTKFLGAFTLAGRAMFKWGERGGRGDGQLFVAETAHTRVFGHGFHDATGIEKGVFYANFFAATRGWSAISGGNFNRLATNFEVNPLVTIAANPTPDETFGVALGVQLFRHHEDESFIPEIAFSHPDSSEVFGLGMRYLRKTGCRSYLETRSVKTFSDDDRFERHGIFVSHFIVF